MSYVYIIVSIYIYMQLVLLQLWNIPMIKMAVEWFGLWDPCCRENRYLHWWQGQQPQQQKVSRLPKGGFNHCFLDVIFWNKPLSPCSASRVSTHCFSLPNRTPRSTPGQPVELFSHSHSLQFDVQIIFFPTWEQANAKLKIRISQVKALPASKWRALQRHWVAWAAGKNGSNYIATKSTDMVLIFSRVSDIGDMRW